MRKILIYFLLLTSANIFGACCPEHLDTQEPETVDAAFGGEMIVAGDFENTKKFRKIVEPEYNEYKDS